MGDSPLGKLYRARLGAQRQMAKLEPQLDGYRKHLAEFEAKIIKLDGLLFLPPGRRANPYFKPGELPRIAPKLMKEADGAVSVRYLAARALALKGCPYPTPVVNADHVGQARAGGKARQLADMSACAEKRGRAK